MSTKKSLLALSFAFVATFAAVTIVILDEDRSSEKIATSEAVPESLDSPETLPANRNSDQGVEEPKSTESSIDERLLRYVDAGYVNREFLDFAKVGDRDPRFQERFFVLRRSTTPATLKCFKVALDDQTHTCWDDYAYNPYFAYDVATLRQLADTDAVAAVVLAIKLELTSAGESLYFRLRSAQLSGKPGPLVAYLRTHSVSFDTHTYELVNVEEALQQYTIALVVDAMGYPYRQAKEQLALLKRYGVPGDLQELALADSVNMLAQLGDSP